MSKIVVGVTASVSFITLLAAYIKYGLPYFKHTKKKQKPDNHGFESIFTITPYVHYPDSSSYSCPVGLPNLGTTCYLNSLIQALANLDGFVTYLQFRNLRSDSTAMSITLFQVIKSLSSSIDYQNPRKLYGLLLKKFTYKFQQEDITELWYFILDEIKDTGNSLPFNMKIQQEIVCKKCGNKHQSIQNETAFNVKINDGNYNSSLNQLLANCLAPETVDSFKCIKCSLTAYLHRDEALKNSAVFNYIYSYIQKDNIDEDIFNIDFQSFLDTIGIQDIPIPSVESTALITKLLQKILCILINRIGYLYDGYIQASKHSFYSNLCLPSMNNGNDAYKINSIVVHIGNNVEYGHYICYKRFKYTPESPHTWAMISDNSFSIVTEENAMSTQPYLMFYEKA